jgi:hypothetical protein
VDALDVFVAAPAELDDDGPLAELKRRGAGTLESDIARARPGRRIGARMGRVCRSLSKGAVMSEWSDEQHDPPATGGENRGAEEDAASQGGEGARNADVTPPIGDDAVKGQTQAPAPPGDVGVPSDEEIAREEGAAGAGE